MPREVYLAIIDGMAVQGIDGVILGCAEIGMLVEQRHTDIKLYDTTAIPALQALDLALN